MILRYVLFSILPLVVEISFILITVAYKYSIKFFLTNLACFIAYTIATLSITEGRAKHFKEQTKKAAVFTQKATDSLLNFETVKYFNAEDHEEIRFFECLVAYKDASINVTKSLVALNMSQSFCIVCGL